MMATIIVNQRFRDHGEREATLKRYDAQLIDFLCLHSEILRKMSVTNVRVGGAILPDIMYVQIFLCVAAFCRSEFHAVVFQVACHR